MQTAKHTHLDAFFKGMRVIEMSSDTLRRHIETRREDEAADATIRRNLVLLRSMLNLARKEGKLRLADIPHFPMPAESKPRKGFVTPEVFAQLRNAFPKHIRPRLQATRPSTSSSAPTSSPARISGKPS
jgi:integrase